MASITLYIGNHNYSSWSLRPWILLRHLGIDFDEVLIPLDQNQPVKDMYTSILKAAKDDKLSANARKVKKEIGKKQKAAA